VIIRPLSSLIGYVAWQDSQVGQGRPAQLPGGH
jgi:hypothetical protein